MKRILLGIPEKHSLDALYPPVGLLYLAAMARNQGHMVKVMDAQVVGEEALLTEFVHGDYEYFGTTILTPLRESSYALIRKIKALKHHCTVIAGGAHISILPKQTMEHVPEIDIAVAGEGEQTLVEILSGKNLSDIQGIWYRHNGQLVHTKHRKSLDPAFIPMPAWDLIDLTPYRAYEDVIIDGISFADKPFLTIYSSRGCTGSCSFCSTWWIWRNWRQIPASRFVDEIEYLYHRGIDHFFIADDSMINKEEFVHQFSNEIIRRKINIKYKIACRADKLTYPVVDSLKKSGCYEIHIGFESGSQRILDSIGKKMKVEDNIQAAKLVREAGLRLYALIIVGAVEEDLETINETIRFLKKIKPDVVATMGGLMLLPGTRDYRKAVRQGVVSDDFWLGQETFPFYTKNFSKKELQLLCLAVLKRQTIWSRKLLHLQFLLCYPMQYANIMEMNRAAKKTICLYSHLYRLCSHLYRLHSHLYRSFSRLINLLYIKVRQKSYEIFTPDSAH
ncbi:MAG: radical SAM protein [bacterium]